MPTAPFLDYQSTFLDRRILTMSTPELTNIVRERYGEAAKQAIAGAKSSCCGTGTSCGADPITSNLYSGDESSAVPSLAIARTEIASSVPTAHDTQLKGRPTCQASGSSTRPVTTSR